MVSGDSRGEEEVYLQYPLKGLHGIDATSQSSGTEVQGHVILKSGIWMGSRSFGRAATLDACMQGEHPCVRVRACVLVHGGVKGKVIHY